MRPAVRLEPHWRLANLLDGLAKVPADQNVTVYGIAQDSREVRPGDVFFACRGGKSHGMGFAAEALDRGAVAVVFEPQVDLNIAPIGVPCVAVENLGRRLGEIAARFFLDPSQALTVFAVTGTDGKTSVSHFIAQALDDPFARCGLIGTLGHGMPGELSPQVHTTPDAVQLQEILSQLRDAGASALAMEASSHALDQGRLSGIVVDVAVLTNLGRDHLDYHGDIESYADAKRGLFVRDNLRAAVINADDAFGRELVTQVRPGCLRIGYGTDSHGLAWDGFLRAESIESTSAGLKMVVAGSYGRAEISSSLLGRFNAHNLLAALGALLGAGLDFGSAVERLRRVRAVAGRMEAFGGSGKPLVVVDYAHTPQALENALSSLRAHCAGALWCVFGCGGDRDPGKRALMGKIAEEFSDRVILTNDNPRSELPEKILSDILAGFKQPERPMVIPDRAQAIEVSLSKAHASDVILVAGKGHESVQVVSGCQYPFSDREWVLALL